MVEKYPTKEEILWALKNPDTGRAIQIINKIVMHRCWSNGRVLHRCPLCGYETEATNLCRDCPKNPTENPVPMYVVDSEVRIDG